MAAAASVPAARWHSLTFVSYASPPTPAKINESADSSDAKSEEYWKLNRSSADFCDVEVFVKAFGRAGRDGYEVSLRHNRFPLKCVKVHSPTQKVAVRPLITCCPAALEIGLPKDGEFFEEVVFVQESNDDGVYHCPRGLGVRSDVLQVIDKAKNQRRLLLFGLRIAVEVLDGSGAAVQRVNYDLPQRFFLIRGNYSIPMKNPYAKLTRALAANRSTARVGPCAAAGPTAISPSASDSGSPEGSPLAGSPTAVSALSAATAPGAAVVRRAPSPGSSSSSSDSPSLPRTERKRAPRDDDADALRVLKKLAAGRTSSASQLPSCLPTRPKQPLKHAPLQFELLLLALDHCSHVEVDDSS